MFVLDRRDLTVNDVAPIEVRRVYRPGDYNERHFGIGMSFGYDYYFYYTPGATYPYTLYLPDGAAVHYTAGTSTNFADSPLLYTTNSPGPFYHSTLSLVGGSTIGGAPVLPI